MPGFGYVYDVYASGEMCAGHRRDDIARVTVYIGTDLET